MPLRHCKSFHFIQLIDFSSSYYSDIFAILLPQGRSNWCYYSSISPSNKEDFVRKRLAGTSYLSLLYQRDRVSAYWKHLTGVWVLFLQSHNHFSLYRCNSLVFRSYPALLSKRDIHEINSERIEVPRSNMVAM